MRNSRRANLYFRARSERAVSYIEAAIVLPLLLVLIFVIVDLSRYWGVQGSINQGAQRGLDVAIKIPDLDFDPDVPGASGDPNYPKFIKARTTVIAEAAKLPSSVLVSDPTSNSSLVRFVGFDNYPIGDGTSVTPAQVNAVLLLPGECVTDRDGEQHCHPTVCPASGDCVSLGQGARRRLSSDTMQQLLETDPMVVAMPVRYRPLFAHTITGSFKPLGLAGGYREILTSGAYPVPPDVPTQTPTPKPTTGPGGPTPEPTQAATGTPTPIPCSPSCDSPAIMNDCQLNHNSGCAVCDNGTCVCTNDCSSVG